MKKLLWLDDYRDPFNKETDWMVFSPIGRDVEVHWVKRYWDFVNWIKENGLPDGMCFDHDLSDIHCNKSTYKEKTGFSCAQWLVDYCLDNDCSLPAYNIQSANPVGKENIDALLKGFNKSREKEVKQEGK